MAIKGDTRSLDNGSFRAESFAMGAWVGGLESRG